MDWMSGLEVLQCFGVGKVKDGYIRALCIKKEVEQNKNFANLFFV
nr:hypothetical protein [uncultured Cetobacterium sp.]